LVAAVSFLLALGCVLAFHVQSVLWIAVGTAVLWVPISLFLNVYSTRFAAPTLKKWRPRRRTFFEWLYERDKIKAPKITDEDKKEG